MSVRTKFRFIHAVERKASISCGSAFFAKDRPFLVNLNFADSVCAKRIMCEFQSAVPKTAASFLQ